MNSTSHFERLIANREMVFIILMWLQFVYLVLAVVDVETFDFDTP